MGRNPLYAFLLKGALWLPLCLGLWYWQAEWFNWPTAMVSGWILHGLFPWVESVEWSQRVIDVVTTLRMDNVPSQEGRYATLVAEANPLIYSYGLPLFVALFMASGEAKRWRKLLLGVLLLIPFQTWGVCFDILKQVAITAGQGVADQADFSAWQREVIALGYQLGYLILPTLAPIVLWLMLSPQFIPMLMLEGALQHEESPAQQEDDAVITAKVKAALSVEPELQFGQINVETHAGVVRLSGKVNSQESISKAISIAQGIKGTRSVRNEMKLVM